VRPTSPHNKSGYPLLLIFIIDSCINEPTKIVIMEEEEFDEWFPDQEI